MIRRGADQETVFLDAMVIIEAVRTKCWNAITGRFAIQTVEVVRDEVRRENRGRPGFVPVSEADVKRIADIHAVSEDGRAVLALEYSGAAGLDFGERDLIAYAIQRMESEWRLCTADMAAIRAGVKLGWGDRLCSLEELASSSGCSPKPPLFQHFTSKWLASERVKHLLM